jgi:hypothetical protein
MTLAVALDFGLEAAGSPAWLARGALLVVWAVLMPAHVLSTGRRNYRLIAALEERTRAGRGHSS